jgi:hypothetical protein
MQRLISTIALILLSSTISANPNPYAFSNPSFSGIGWSSHVITLEQLTQKGKKERQDKIDQEIREAEREADSSNLARFINNFESRVYAQLSKALVDALFGDEPSASGTIELAGTVINYTNDGTEVSLEIIGADGNVTVVTVPVGAFGL